MIDFGLSLHTQYILFVPTSARLLCHWSWWRLTRVNRSETRRWLSAPLSINVSSRFLGRKPIVLDVACFSPCTILRSMSCPLSVMKFPIARSKKLWWRIPIIFHSGKTYRSVFLMRLMLYLLGASSIRVSFQVFICVIVDDERFLQGDREAWQRSRWMIIGRQDL